MFCGYQGDKSVHTRAGHVPAKAVAEEDDATCSAKTSRSPNSTTPHARPLPKQHAPKRMSLTAAFRPSCGSCLARNCARPDACQAAIGAGVEDEDFARIYPEPDWLADRQLRQHTHLPLRTCAAEGLRMIRDFRLVASPWPDLARDVARQNCGTRSVVKPLAAAPSPCLAPGTRNMG